MAIGTLIKTIQDIMRKDVGVDGDAQRISQIVWLLFLKIFDDKEQEWELTVPGYKSPLSNRFRWTNWAKDAEGITGEELIDFVNNNLFPVLKTLATAAGVWFFEHPYPPGYKSYSRSKPLTIQEFDREKLWWKNRQPSEYAWKVSAQEIAARNYNLDCKNPHEVAINHRDPDELMREYLEIDRQMQDAQNSLKQELIRALGSH